MRVDLRVEVGRERDVDAAVARGRLSQPAAGVLFPATTSTLTEPSPVCATSPFGCPLIETDPSPVLTFRLPLMLSAVTDPSPVSSRDVSR